jgi:cytochrome c-type biogenesis protein CcmE
MKKQVKFGIGIGVIVVSMGCLAWLGYGESKTYYHTLAELDGLKGSERSQHMRIGGTVAEGSIHRMTGRVDFVLEGEGKSLNVSYVGSDPLPDTFVDKSQALIEGKPTAEGRFVADHVQAKCASKYEAAPGGTPATPGGAPSKSQNAEPNGTTQRSSM